MEEVGVPEWDGEREEGDGCGGGEGGAGGEKECEAWHDG